MDEEPERPGQVLESNVSVGVVSVELCIAEGTREKLGVLACSKLAVDHLFAQLKKASGRLPSGDVQLVVLIALHSAFLRERKESLLMRD